MNLKKWRSQAMRYNIISTGSGGNCALATFSDEKKVMFDFGKGCFKKCTEAGLVLNSVDQILISHAHNDHIGDAGMIPHLLEKRANLEVYTFALTHNVENQGFLVANLKTKEAFYYLTDFYSIPGESFNLIKNTLQLLFAKNYKIIFVMELSYCQHLFEKLDDTHKFGLQHHLSDVGFFKYAKIFKAIAPNINFIHKPNRVRKKAGMAPYWVKIFRLEQFGVAFGFSKTYNYIEHKFKAN